jgi:hypothetical protein
MVMMSMRGTNPLVGVGLAGLAGLALLFVASKAKGTPTAAPATTSTPPAQPPGAAVPPFVPGVQVPAGQPTTNADALRLQLQNLLTQVAIAPQSIDPGQFNTLESALRANGLANEADQVHAAAVEFNRGRAA